MGKPEDTLKEIRSITALLISAGLADNQNFPVLRQLANRKAEVTFDHNGSSSTVLKNIAYGDVYHELKRDQNFNISMADGALIQLQYIFENNSVVQHRLAFFPSPDLLAFQNDPELYQDDMVYAEVMEKNVVASPVRFDFDKDAFLEIDHPMSHMTIGQYKNCRIPVRSAIGPFRFFEFILRSFYNTAFKEIGHKLKNMNIQHPKTVTPPEENLIHVGLECL